MSLWVFSSPLLSLNPAVHREPDRLTARTHLLLQLLSLFSFSKRVVVDRRKKTVTIDVRFCWALRSVKTIPFSRIERIDYRFASIGTDWGTFLQRTDQVEWFHVGLVLKGPQEEVRLFSFRGEGSVTTGMFGVILGDSIIDVEGDQADASRDLIGMLQELTGATLTGPMPHIANAAGERLSCSACKRPSPPNKKVCMYCGGALVRL